MISLVALCSLAFAAEPAFAGVPVSALPALGITDPTFIDDADVWKGVVPGGWAIHTWGADAAGAEANFRFTLSTIQVALPLVMVVGADEARGDDHLVLARRGNVVVQVRGEHALAEAAAILAAEVPESNLVRVAVPGMDPAAERDLFGRRVR